VTNWTAENIPDQTGRIVVITGASSGIGAAAALALASKGAHIILAVRDPARGDAIRARISSQHPNAKTAVATLDLASLANVRAFATRMGSTVPRIDILLNNAGLGLQPIRGTTDDGFERQFGTNHLGHFALTGLLLPHLLAATAPRVVTIASIAHRRGRIDFADLQGERTYNASKAYSQSKLANLLFAFDLARRAAATPLLSVAAHPGVASTGFVAAIGMPAYKSAIGNLAIRLFGQNATKGALPGLYAATMPEVKSGQYWGPDGFMEIRGQPRLAKVEPQAKDLESARRLWEVSEKLTGVSYSL
jgi:NAD(P)-dependent dehydrogenase (short-subunit alcohol dehydrogenase family)